MNAEATKTKKPDRLKKVNETIDKIAVRACKNDNFLNASQIKISAKLDISLSTVRKTSKKYGLRAHKLFLENLY